MAGGAYSRMIGFMFRQDDYRVVRAEDSIGRKVNAENRLYLIKIKYQPDWALKGGRIDIHNFSPQGEIPFFLHPLLAGISKTCQIRG